MKKIGLILSLLFIVVACSSGDKGNNNGNNNGGDEGFDRTALLTNWADNIIIPGYQNYQSKVQELTVVANTFVADPTEANLQSMRTSWIEAYKAYQYITMYAFGKAQEINFREVTNMYPINNAGIEANIVSGTYDLSKPSQWDKQGLPALDYLINGLAADDASIVAFYSSNLKAANYKQYLTDVIGRLKINVDLIVTHWNSGYRNTYVSNKDNTTSGSINITVNNFVKSIERDIRAGKVGIPCGMFSAGVLFPEKVEAYYKNDISKELLNVSVQANQDFFNGKHFGKTTSGESLKSCLDYLNATNDGQKLSDIINNQYTAVFTANAALNNSFSQQINTDNSKMLDSFGQMQELVVLTKIDMMQALKITIDYVDSDGD